MENRLHFPLRTAAFSTALLVSCVLFAQPLFLRAGAFDPLRSVSPALPELLQTPQPGQEGQYIVQFKGGVTQNDRAMLDSRGVENLGYLPRNAYVIETTPERLAQLKESQRVRWIGPFQPQYKLDPELGFRRLVSLERISERLQGLIRFDVVYFDGRMPGPLPFGAELLDSAWCGPRIMAEYRGTLAQARFFATRPEVAFVEEVGEISYRNDTTQWVIQTNTPGYRLVWDEGLRGENQIIGVIDGPVDINHNGFRDPVNNTPGPGHRKVVYYSSNSGIGADLHGTHTSGTVAGDREPINGLTTNNGIAERARLAFTNLSDVTSVNLYTKLMGAYNAGARDNSNSWGDDSTRQYTSRSLAVDQFSWDREDALVAFAVSNGSVVTTPENAKSCLAVGATNQAPNQDTAGTGGTGPTSDGRQKPEVWSPGVGIVSARAGTRDGFTTATGTSMACPSVAAAAALARQYYSEGWAVAGKKNPAVGYSPSGALLRATLITSGADMTGLPGYPGAREGWGRVLLRNVLWFGLPDQPRTLFWDRRNAKGLLSGAVISYKFIVTNSAMPLRVTMSFTDYPAAIYSSEAAVNDVDLIVTSPDGKEYKGNVFDQPNGESVSGGTSDPRNSTEMVLVKTPTSGVWKVSILARAVNQGGRQGYALVANGGVTPLKPIP